MLTSRRNFLGLLAAPALVRASSLMKVVPIPEEYITIDEIGGLAPQWGDKITMHEGEWRGIEFVEGITLSKVGEELQWTRGLVRYVPFPELASM